MPANKKVNTDETASMRKIAIQTPNGIIVNMAHGCLHFFSGNLQSVG